MARFTLDSATEFLFGGSVKSLGAGIPYPPSDARKNPPLFHNHPSNVFVDAFIQGQTQAAVRSGMGAEWALAELTKDKIAPFRAAMDDFTEPLMKAALEEQKVLLADDKSLDGKEETLLAHLVKNTQGLDIRINGSNQKVEYIVLRSHNLERRGRVFAMPIPCVVAFTPFYAARQPLGSRPRYCKQAVALLLLYAA